MTLKMNTDFKFSANWYQVWRQLNNVKKNTFKHYTENKALCTAAIDNYTKLIANMTSGKLKIVGYFLECFRFSYTLIIINYFEKLIVDK